MTSPLIQHNFQVGEYPIHYFISPGRLVELRLNEDSKKTRGKILEGTFTDFSLRLLEYAPAETGTLVQIAKDSGKPINMLHAHGTSDKSKWKMELGYENGPYEDVLKFLNLQDCAGWIVDCCNPREYEIQEGQTKYPIIYPGKSVSLAEVGLECPIKSVGLREQKGNLETTVDFLNLVWDKKYGVTANFKTFRRQYERIRRRISEAYLRE